MSYTNNESIEDSQTLLLNAHNESILPTNWARTTLRVSHMLRLCEFTAGGPRPGDLVRAQFPGIV
jgi:hypothetical protein